MDMISLWMIRLVVGGLAILPFCVIYVLSDVLYIILYKIGRYRRSVVLTNLRTSFPSKSETEIKRLAAAYYQNLCDVTLETMKGLSLTTAEIRNRFRIHNIDILAPPLQEEKSVLLMGSHMSNWEWGSLAVAPFIEAPVFGIYKRLRNAKVNAYFNKKRGQFGLHLVPMEHTAKTLAIHRKTPSLYCLIADQTPSNKEKAHWIQFLNQETPFHRGTDQLARSTDFPVFYYDTRRIKRGYYEVTLYPLTMHPGQLEEGEVTLRYARKLESIIHEEPADWLWSHRRWKHKRPADTHLIENLYLH